MKKQLMTAILYTVVTTLLLGIAYPLVVTGLAHLISPEKAAGQMITRNGVVIGSRIIAQPFTSDKYFHPRPSAAGSNGYDATNSSGSNYGPTNQKLIDAVKQSVQSAGGGAGKPVPIDLVTASGSGLDPDITVAAAWFQIARVAKARSMEPVMLQRLVQGHTTHRQLGVLGEERINVLELNLALDDAAQNIRDLK